MDKLERWGPLLLAAIALVAVLAYMESDSRRHGRSEKAIEVLERQNDNQQRTIQSCQNWSVAVYERLSASGINLPIPPTEEMSHEP